MRWKLFNLSGSYSPKLASISEKMPTAGYPAACCGEIHYMEKLFNDLNMSVNSVISADHLLKNEKVYGKNKKI